MIPPPVVPVPPPEPVVESVPIQIEPERNAPPPPPPPPPAPTFKPAAPPTVSAMDMAGPLPQRQVLPPPPIEMEPEFLAEEGPEQGELVRASLPPGPPAPVRASEPIDDTDN